MHRPMDTEAQALINRIKHHHTHIYINKKSSVRNSDEIRAEFERLDSLPAKDLTPAVWDKLNRIMNSNF